MRELARAVKDLGEPLPFRFVPKVDLHPGFLVILLAAPGVGKSFLALNEAVDLVKVGKPVLYHTTDTDYRTQALRLTALLRNTTIDEVDIDEAAGWLARMVLPLRWSQAPVNTDTFEELVKAEVEYLGEPPALTIVDVANDLRKGEENAGNTRDIFVMLHKVARRQGTTILAVHHVKRGFASNGKQAPGLDDGLYGGEGQAEVVLGLSRPNQNQLRLDVLKNRAGPSGATTYLNFIPERGRVA